VSACNVPAAENVFRVTGTIDIRREVQAERLAFRPMTSRGRLIAPAVLMATCLGMLAPPFTSAKVTNVETFYPQDSGLSFSVRASPGDDDVSIDLGVYPTPHRVIDPAGVTLSPPDCEQESATAVSCLSYNGHFRVRLMAGDDGLTLTGIREGIVTAGGGSDDVHGAAGSEDLYGDEGDDDVVGATGDDLLDGGPGADELRGSAGADKIRAADGKADAVIDCGPGDDFARIDRGLDPRPRHCEQILRIG